MRKYKYTLQAKQARWGIRFAIPGLLGFFIFYIIPLFIMMYYSLINRGGKLIFFGNYINMFHVKSFVLAIKNTLYFILIGTPLLMFISMILALFIEKMTKINLNGIGAIKACIIIPLLIPTGVIVLFTQILFERSGVINSWLESNVDWLRSEPWPFILLVIIYLWKNCGYSMIIFLAAIRGIDPEIREAAQCDGAASLTVFRKITLPQIKPSLFFVFIMSIIGVFKMNRESFLLMGDYPNNSVYMLQNFIRNNLDNLNYQHPSCAALLFLFMMIIVVWCMVHNSE